MSLINDLSPSLSSSLNIHEPLIAEDTLRRINEILESIVLISALYLS